MLPWRRRQRRAKCQSAGGETEGTPWLPQEKAERGCAWRASPKGVVWKGGPRLAFHSQPPSPLQRIKANPPHKKRAQPVSSLPPCLPQPRAALSPPPAFGACPSPARNPGPPPRGEPVSPLLRQPLTNRSRRLLPLPPSAPVSSTSLPAFAALAKQRRRPLGQTFLNFPESGLSTPTWRQVEEAQMPGAAAAARRLSASGSNNPLRRGGGFG